MVFENNFGDFVRAFKDQYDIVDYQTKVREDAYLRTQHRNEKMIAYLTSLRYVMDKISPTLSLRDQLDLAYRNLHPEYKKDIFRSQINSYGDLIKLEKLVEDRLEGIKS